MTCVICRHVFTCRDLTGCGRFEREPGADDEINEETTLRFLRQLQERQASRHQLGPKEADLLPGQQHLARQV